MLATELAAGEKLRTVPGETVARMKIDLGLPDTENLAPAAIGQVRKNLGTDYVVVGSYFDLGQDSGGEIRLDVRVQDTAKGETIAAVSGTSTEAQLLDLVSRVGRKLREALGVAESPRLNRWEFEEQYLPTRRRCDSTPKVWRSCELLTRSQLGTC